MAENSSCSSASTCGKSSCEGCPSNKGGNGIPKEPMNQFSNVKKVIGVVSGKGGVGKSFVTASLACAMKKAGYQVGIMDADITGPSIPKMLGVHGQIVGDERGMIPMEAENGIKVMSVNLLLDHEEDPVIWRGPVIASAVKQFWEEVSWGDVDFMFVDMPPGTGDVPLTVFQSLPLDGIIIVSTPQSLVSMIVQKAVSMAQRMDIPVLGMVENMRFIKCPDCGKEIPLFGSDDAVDSTNVPVLERIPLDPKVAAACDAGSLAQSDVTYLTKTAQILADSFGEKKNQ